MSTVTPERPGPQADPPSSKFFFVHPMKTGGGTFVGYLRQQFGADAVYPSARDGRADEQPAVRNTVIRRLLAIPPDRHDEICAYTGHFPTVAAELLGAQLGQSLCTITILREPVDRTISHLKHRAEREPACQGMRLEQIYEQRRFYVSRLHNHLTRFFALTPGDRPRAFYQRIEFDDERLAVAKENLASVDVIGLTDRYAELISHTRRSFGWSELRRSDANVSGEHPEPDQAFRDRIAEDNAVDVELYRFATELYERRKREGAGP